MKNIIVLLFLVTITQLNAQSITEKRNFKGTFFAYFGWNLSSYTNSDITFSGDNYNFTLEDATASDKPTKFGIDPHLTISKLTTPATNLRIGYFFHDKYSISFGLDHMKYVLDQGQTVKIKGEINTGGSFDATYTTGQEIKISPDFLTFEHTDGLNYGSFEIKRQDKIAGVNLFEKYNIELYLTEGVGFGFVMPRSNVRLFNSSKYDQYHLAGYGVNLVGGLNLLLFNHLSIQSTVKGGYINLSDIRTTNSTSDKAKQDFFFLQGNIIFGYMFRLWKPKSEI